MERLRLSYEKNIVWIYPLLNMVGALILSLVVILLDTRGFMIYEYVPRIFLTSVSLAREILGALVGSLLTITTFTFSTIMVVLTMYASNYSPRVVENFLREKISLKVMGIFIGGFFYSITSLLFMRDALESDLVISASIGVLYAAMCVVYFVRFVHKVSTSVQANYVINTLTEEAQRVYDSMVERNMEDVSFKEDLSFDFERFKAVYSNDTGYVQLISFDPIFSDLKDHKAEVILRVKTGDFIVKGEKIAYISNDEEDELTFSKEQSEEELGIEAYLNEHIVIDPVRNDSYDYRYAIEKIQEVAVRALSPSTNDPVTAVDCIHSISHFLSLIAQRNDGYYVLEEEDSPAKLYYEGTSFKTDAYHFLQSIIQYGGGDLSVVFALFDVLKDIAARATWDNKEVVLELAEYVYDKALMEITHEVDVTRIKKSFDDLEHFVRTNQKYKEEEDETA